MKRILVITACAIALPATTLAGTRTYETGTFEGVSAAAGVDVDITVGPTRSIVAETRSDDFGDLQISVEDNVLKIRRSYRHWFGFWWNRPNYRVRVVTPALHSLA